MAEFEPDYKIVNNIGDTLLHVAVSNNDTKMCRLLISLGGDEIL